MEYTELERKQIAELEYDNNIHVGSDVKNGTVREVVTDDFGQKAYVIQSEDKKEVSVIYRGSEGPGTPGSAVDCLDNDFIITCKNKYIS
ncbi:hypothetical protein MXZ89_08240 [Streptococcus uberis]|uniref:hypothetical protein n=1 Tax=Streptococcus uberis TaxID=1349 RepID=UPI001FF3C469|nr:hypothetical protein [Streptococcus uberis]MCK1217305.1 hypothetical protein [Streptococcus uberis]